MNNSFMNEVKSAARSRILGLIRKPQAQVKKNTPRNMAPLALIGFNLVMTLLDLISAFVVAMLTDWFYGVLTFASGVFALFLWERLFTNAHGNLMQKWLAVGGMALAVVSTLGIGILSAIVNVLDIAGEAPVMVIEGGMLVALVVIAFVHGIAWGVYYFADPTHVAEMKRMVSIAFREQQKRGLQDAKEDLSAVLEIDRELQEYERSGQLDLLSASYENLRGQALVQGGDESAYQEWLQKGAETSVPLPGGGEELEL